MKQVQPKAILLTETRIIPEGLQDFLLEMGVPHWSSDGESDTEVVVEVAGKLCYMSFDTSLNKNLTRTGTRSNRDYIQQGIIGQSHGSVLEHVAVGIVFTNVSRVFTHELVRHRAGAAYSQTSGRYVRPDELAFWLPTCIAQHPELQELFKEAVEHQEKIIAKLEEVSGINAMTSPSDFQKKKELTSAFRRIVGNGAATNILATYNHRALRHLIALRTSRHAEEEIRLVFADLFKQLRHRYDAIYSDATVEEVNGIPEVTFKVEKV